MIPSIAAYTPATPIEPVTPAPPTKPTQTTDASAPTSGVSTAVDTIPSSPPGEVLEAMGAASDRYDSLAAENKHVGVEVVDGGGGVKVQVTDLQGNVISPPLPPSGVFDILDGKD